MASASTAWALWALTGLFGGHLFYLGRYMIHFQYMACGFIFAVVYALGNSW